MASILLSEIVTLLEAKTVGVAADSYISGIAGLDMAADTDISFFENIKLKSTLATTKAAAVIISSQHESWYDGAKLIVANPRYALAKISQIFVYNAKHSGVAASAVIGENCNISSSAIIGANAVIGNAVQIGANAIIGAGAVVEDFAVIGANTVLKPNTSIMHHCELGQNCLIHSGAVIGSDGLGFAFDNAKWHKIEHLGRVVIGDEVEIGASTSIDRGTFGDTIIGDGVKLDNQIQIGHNVFIGDGTIIAGCVGIAGSAKIGKYCQIGGGSLINGHITIVDKVVITGGASVLNSINKPGVYSSITTVMPHKEWGRNLVCYKKLYKLSKTVAKLEKAK